jgi:hypothetical protein
MIAHGTASKYSNDKCRCADCRRAWVEYNRLRRATRWAWTAEGGLPATVKHGSSAYYNWGCHCPICLQTVAAAAARNRALRATKAT